MSNLFDTATAVGSELGAIEKAHLAQLGDSITLIASLLAAGRSLEIPFGVQQRMLAPALQAIGKLAEVGQGYADTHAHLSAYVRKNGLDPRFFGESDSGPSASAEPAKIRIVA